MNRRLRILTISATMLIGLASVACSSGSPASSSAPESQAAPTTAASPTPPPAVGPPKVATPSAAAQASSPVSVAAAPTPVQPAPTAVAEPVEIVEEVASNIENFVLEELTVVVGTNVTWTNLDGSRHTSTSGARSAITDFWDSPVLKKGESFSFTFTEVGTFLYFCRVHPTSMNSTVTVVPADQLGMVTSPPEPTNTAVSAAIVATPTATPEPTKPASAPATAVPVVMAATPIVTPEPTTAIPTPTPIPPTFTPVPPTSTPVPTSTVTSMMVPPEESPTITSEIFDFQLEDLVITIGTTVTWINKDPVAHTSTQGPGPRVAMDALWDSPNLNLNNEFSFTFTDTGEFIYFCRFHDSMVATITVVEAGDPNASMSSTTEAVVSSGDDEY